MSWVLFSTVTVIKLAGVSERLSLRLDVVFDENQLRKFNSRLVLLAVVICVGSGEAARAAALFVTDSDDEAFGVVVELLNNPPLCC